MPGSRAQQGQLSVPFELGQHPHSQARKWRSGNASVPWRFAEALDLEVKEGQGKDQKHSRQTCTKKVEMKPEVEGL